LSGAELTGADLSLAKLQGADLTGAALARADLHAADLTGARLRAAELPGADLSGACLKGAFLGDAVLGNAVLYQSDLSAANLTRARLHYAVLNGTSLVNADLTRAAFGSTMLGSVDLSQVRGLEKVEHNWPSTIGIDTLYLSRGKVPEEFLRGCGVPDGLITYLPSLIGAEEGFLFYSCFISYSHKDEEFAKKIHARMRKEHLRVWYAPEDLKAGDKIHEQIDRAIRTFDKLLLVLSEHSIGSSWVRTEIKKARKAERETGKRKLFPICLVDFDAIREWECFDADGGENLAAVVREYFIPDFSAWQEEAKFYAAFERLLGDLRAQ
jgi:hypothetical protein